MCRGLGHCPLGSALTGVSQQPSPRYQYRMTLIKKTGKEGSTRWVAERDSLAGPRMCGPHGHSVAAGGIFIPQYTVEGCLSWVSPCLSVASFLFHAHWWDLPSRYSRCATPPAVVAQCLCTYRSPAQNDHPFAFCLAVPWRPCSNHACVSISSVRIPELPRQDSPPASPPGRLTM